MGVPAFYRWLSEKYPKAIEDILEERVVYLHGTHTRIPFDATRPNPSGLECDNLYIDMNGIIHPCSHPEVGPQPTCEEEMFDNVCRYVDRLFRVMRPRQLLYLAIDGVAPRAKMNQQRSRRFRSAQEARETAELEEHVRTELTQMGQVLPKAKPPWDSNVITPGTPFMLKLSEFIRFYIRKRIREDRAWQSIRVIFSDASIPGEGEHKIMSHVRLQRSQPGYNPNLVHVLHGLDADLIMLALATHEVNFYISRELVLFGRKSQEDHDQRQMECGFRDKQRLLDEAASDAMELVDNQGKPLQRVNIPILREYLAFEFKECLTGLPFTPSLERLIDDIVFLCFFVGNDFLPHLPSLDIRDGALDFLFNVYKRLLPSLGDYITNHGGQVNLSHVDVILAEVGAIEDYVFSMKHANEENQKKRRQDMLKRNTSRGPPHHQAIKQEETPKVMGRAAKILEQQRIKEEAASKTMKQTAKANAVAAAELKRSLGLAAVKEESQEEGTKRKAEEISEDLDNETVKAEPEGDDDDEEDEFAPEITVPDIDPETARKFKEQVKAQQQKKLDEYSTSIEDNVRLHEAGWKDRYYSDKCKADDVTQHGGREHLFRSYVMGLCWVMKYYYDGCPSWKWYYPFHYAPFASDLKNIERFQKDCKNFELAEPFKPVEQLMAVLPEDSKHAIPKASRWLMYDEESPIIDFYPKEVPVDPNGKAMPWLWVVLLPFIEEDRLLAAYKPTVEKWTSTELFCNARGLDDGYVYVHKTHPLAPKLEILYESADGSSPAKLRVTDGSAGKRGLTGSIRLPLSNEVIKVEAEVQVELPASAEQIKRSTHDNLFTEPIHENMALCAAFTEPPKLSHKSVLLPGARPPPAKLKREDLVIRRPRLNRGGGTIANLGAANGRSQEQGYGSMNIGTYERNVAERNGRGRDMYQTGIREWGAAEPMPKKYQIGGGVHHAPYPSNPFNRPPQQQPHHYQPQLPAWQNQQPQWHPNQQQGGNGHVQAPSSQWQNQQAGQRPPFNGGGQQGYNQQGQQQYAHQGYNYQGQQQQGTQRPPHQRPYSGPNQNNQLQQNGGQRQGHTFQHLNRSAPPHAQLPPQRANPNVINDLRSQLASTLQQNRQGGNKNRK
jgi:5'-3' exoribonuclease 2